MNTFSMRASGRGRRRGLISAAIILTLIAASSIAGADDDPPSKQCIDDEICRFVNDAGSNLRVTPVVPKVRVSFSGVALPIATPVGVTLQAGEECRHISFSRTTYNRSGGKLYDFSFYLAWCANKSSKVITKVLDHSCRTVSHQPWLDYDSPCEDRWNGTPGGGRTWLPLRDQWHLWAGSPCCWNYRPLVDAEFTGDWRVSGYYYYW